MAIITISRTEFSGGDKIAEGVAAQLGLACISRKDLILGASEYFDFPEAKLIEAMDEPPKLWQQDRDKRDAHFNLIRATFLRLCHTKRELVYHGFSGQELIRGVSHVLRVLVIADEECRIEAAIKELNVDRDDAVEVIRKSDIKMSKWSRQMYNLEWDNPSLYDMVLHIGRISMDSAMKVILDLTASGDFHPTEGSQHTFADEYLASMVWSTLTRHERTKEANVMIMARKGIVTIAGTVRSMSMLKDITAVAEKVEGVKQVINEASIGAIWRF